MSGKETAVKVENLSKIYRIGVKEHLNDSFGSALFQFLKSPLKNYRRYRSLYKFDDVKADSGSGSGGDAPDVIWALKDVSFELKQGEALGVIGRNGAGKSSLLKVLSRVTDPTGGRAEIRGRVSSLLEVGTGFHPELTGRENVYLNGAVLGMRKREIDRKFDEIVAFSGVERFIDTPVKRYSSGMKVRLAFSVAAHLEPEILIVDEVLAVGDADFQQKCLNKMETVGQQGRTVIFVSHNMAAIARLCNRAILLDEGRVVFDGPAYRAVNRYLTSALGTTAAREWPDPMKAPSGPIARLHAVRVLNHNGEVAEAIDIRKIVQLEMEYEVLQPGRVLLPHFNLITEKGVTAFTSVDVDPEWRRRPRPPGRYCSTASVPGNFLAEGIYYVSCYLITLSPDSRQFAERSVVSFNVIDSTDGDTARGDYSKHMYGVIRPLLKWTTKFTAAEEEKHIDAM